MEQSLLKSLPGGRWRTLGARAFPLLLIAPAMIAIIVLIIVPIVQGVAMSFFATQLGEKAPFIGLGNYFRMVRSPDFLRVIWVTLVYTFFSVIGCFLIALVVALVANAKFRCRAVARVIMTLPWAIPEVAACLIWGWILNYQFGILNQILKAVHLIDHPIGWLMNPKIALASVLGVTLWKIFPLSAVVLLAGLQGVSEDLYEAGRIDGGNSYQLFRHVTLPSLRPIASMLILLTTIWSFRRFTIIWVLTQGGPSMATETLVVGVYRSAFKTFDMGYAAAMAVVGLLLSSLITFVYLIFQSRSESV